MTKIVGGLNGVEKDHSNLALASRQLHGVVQDLRKDTKVVLSTNTTVTKWIANNKEVFKLDASKGSFIAAPVSSIQNLEIGKLVDKAQCGEVLKMCSLHAINLRYIRLYKESQEWLPLMSKLNNFRPCSQPHTCTQVSG